MWFQAVIKTCGTSERPQETTAVTAVSSSSKTRWVSNLFWIEFFVFSPYCSYYSFFMTLHWCHMRCHYGTYAEFTWLVRNVTGKSSIFCVFSDSWKPSQSAFEPALSAAERGRRCHCFDSCSGTGWSTGDFHGARLDKGPFCWCMMSCEVKVCIIFQHGLVGETRKQLRLLRLLQQNLCKRRWPPWRKTQRRRHAALLVIKPKDFI